MMSEEEIREYFKTLDFKKNPNDFEIVKKWNRKVLKEHKYEINNIIEEQIDEYIKELIKTYSHPMAFFDEIKYGYVLDDSLTAIPIDSEEHSWYNKYNKWGLWNKFEDGVIIKYDEK